MPYPVNLENIDWLIKDLEIHGQELGFVGDGVRENDEQLMGDIEPDQLAYYKSLMDFDCSEIFAEVDGLFQQMYQIPSFLNMVSQEYCFSPECPPKKYSPEEIKKFKDIYFPVEEKDGSEDKDTKFNNLKEQRANWPLSKIFEATQFRKTSKFKGVLGFENERPRQPAEDAAIEKVKAKILQTEFKSSKEELMLDAIFLKQVSEDLFNSLAILQKGISTDGPGGKPDLLNTPKGALCPQFEIVIEKLNEIRDHTKYFKTQLARLYDVVIEEKDSSSESKPTDAFNKEPREWLHKLSEKMLKVKKINSDAEIAKALGQHNTFENLNYAINIRASNTAAEEEKSKANKTIEAYRQHLLKDLSDWEEDLVKALFDEYVAICFLTTKENFPAKTVGERIESSKAIVRKAERDSRDDELKHHYKVAHPEIEKTANAYAIAKVKKGNWDEYSEISENASATAETQQGIWDRFKTIVKANYKQFLFYTLIAAGLVALGIFTFGVGTAVGIGATAALGTAGTAVIFGVQRVVQRKYGDVINRFLSRVKLAIFGKTEDPVRAFESDSPAKDSVNAARESKSVPMITVEVKAEQRAPNASVDSSQSDDPRGKAPDENSSGASRKFGR